ncbi:Gut specific cysteine proteinase [Trichuris trichiura]|uniref:Gut specific cysteine proteinase n=1 Tax=Trichuris trichiura TaxID=36087 RepID=A0A077ZGS3_TRITR|nr:Gut specific cysteine proteinase [Trichuris trichiura]
MKMLNLSTFVLIVVSLANAAYYEQRYEELERKFRLDSNSNSQMTWSLTKNPYFKNKSKAEIQRLLGFIPSDANRIEEDRSEEGDNHDSRVTVSKKALPEEYDVRKRYPYCKYIGFIKDQANCGSCWAVSSASVMSDRICIASNGSEQVLLSEEDILSCCATCGSGCDGGNPIEAFNYWRKKGVPTGGPYGSKQGCKPYSIAPCGDACSGTAETPSCKAKCIPQYKIPLRLDRTHGVQLCNRVLPEQEIYLGSKVKFLGSEGTERIMQDLYTNGPLVAGFVVYEDFLYYGKGVYQHKFGSSLGGHAVRIIGWGVEKGVDYWLVANSWNETFGEEGLFRIRRGNNECGFEDYIVASKPRLLS